MKKLTGSRYRLALLILIPILLVFLLILVICTPLENSLVRSIAGVALAITIAGYSCGVLVPEVRISLLGMRLEKRLEGKFADLPTLEKEIDAYPLPHLLRVVQKKYREAYKTDILRKQAEINFLQRQINPHFLYNSLESIRGNAMVKGAHEIAEMTEALATFFRYSISQKGSMVTLEDELNNVRDYFTIQQFRFHNKFEMSITGCQDAASFSQFYLPKLTIQPIVENAIYHGLEPKVGPGRVEIRITITDIRLILNIVDDGIGIGKEKLHSIQSMIHDDTGRESTSIALFNVNRRITLNFGSGYGVFVTSTKNYGTNVEITLPLIDAVKLRNIGALKDEA